MSTIWDNADIKEKILLLSPNLQESFLRAVDALHCKESTFMLTFIQESRDELHDTRKEIEREQEVLRDTSDLLASKRMLGDMDEWEDNLHEMNAVDEYLKKRNNGEVGGLGILSFEDENKSHKKAKKKDKDKEKRKDRDKSSRSRSEALSSKAESHGSELFGMENELSFIEKPSKKEKKEKKDKTDKDRDRRRDSVDDELKVKERKHKPDESAFEIEEAPKVKEKKPKQEESIEVVNDEPKAKEKKHKEKDKKKDKERRKEEESLAAADINVTESEKKEEKEQRREERAERKKREMARRKSEEALDDRKSELKMEREKSAPILSVREQSDIQKETNDLMQEFLTRQSTDIEQKTNFEAALKRKLAKKKNPHAAEADELMKQQAWADREVDREKEAYEAKMMEKLKSRREKSGLTNREMSSLDEPGATSEPIENKHKKEKKKKKSKDKDRDDDGEEKEKKKKKKKDKDREPAEES